MINQESQKISSSITEQQQPVRPPKGSLCPSDAQPRPHPAPAKDAQTTPQLLTPSDTSEDLTGHRR